jgi:hypothetical protein
MTKEEFDAFLAHLDLDRERAGEKYEQIRRKMLSFCRGRGLTDAEKAFDEVIDRGIIASTTGEGRSVRLSRHLFRTKYTGSGECQAV